MTPQHSCLVKDGGHELQAPHWGHSPLRTDQAKQWGQKIHIRSARNWRCRDNTDYNWPRNFRGTEAFYMLTADWEPRSTQGHTHRKWILLSVNYSHMERGENSGLKCCCAGESEASLSEPTSTLSGHGSSNSTLGRERQDPEQGADRANHTMSSGFDLRDPASKRKRWRAI